MKTTIPALASGLGLILLSIFSLSWTTEHTSRNSTVLRFWHDVPEPINLAPTEAAHLMKKLLTVKKIPISPIHVFYTMSQVGSPYLDANLKISINGTQQVFLFVDDSGDFETEGDGYPNYSVSIQIACPVFDQWEDQGRYILSVVGYNPTTMVYTNLASGNSSLGPGNTPNVNALPRTINLTCPVGYVDYEVYINLHSE